MQYKLQLTICSSSLPEDDDDTGKAQCRGEEEQDLNRRTAVRLDEGDYLCLVWRFMVGIRHASAVVAEVVGVQTKRQTCAACIGNRHDITSCGVIW